MHFGQVMKPLLLYWIKNNMLFYFLFNLFFYAKTWYYFSFYLDLNAFMISPFLYAIIENNLLESFFSKTEKD